jgi:hypothetical protein
MHSEEFIGLIQANCHNYRQFHGLQLRSLVARSALQALSRRPSWSSRYIHTPEPEDCEGLWCFDWLNKLCLLGGFLSWWGGEITKRSSNS